MTLGEKLYTLRTKQNMTQEQLAEKVGIGSKHLSRIETARVGVSLDMLFNIADALGVDAYKLLMFH
mgnify:CR=1 FL=1